MAEWAKIWANFRKLPTFVKEEFGPLAIWVGLIAPTVSAVIGARLSPVTTTFLLVIYYLLMGLIAILSRYTNLEAKQAQRIEILWGNGHPYVHYGEFLNVGEIEMLWRVGIQNRSPVNTVHDVGVKLTEMEPQVNVVIPAPLHRMGDNPLRAEERYETTTDIHPKDTEYMDVIGQLKTGELFLYYADKALPQRLPIRSGSEQYKISVKVIGRDMPARARDFKTYLDTNNKLFMEPLNESYEPVE